MGDKAIAIIGMILSLMQIRTYWIKGNVFSVLFFLVYFLAFIYFFREFD